MRAATLRVLFKFEMIRFTGYGVIAQKPLVRHLARNFPCTLYEKLCVGSKKMIPTFFNDVNVVYYRAKFEEDRIRCAGCRCENVVYAFFLSRSDPQHCAFEGYIVRTIIA